MLALIGSFTTDNDNHDRQSATTHRQWLLWARFPIMCQCQHNLLRLCSICLDPLQDDLVKQLPCHLDEGHLEFAILRGDSCSVTAMFPFTLM